MKKTLLKALNRLKLIRNFNFVVAITINNRKFRIPVINKLGFENIEISEPWMIRLMEVCLAGREDKVYVDVGVNLGQTLIKLKSVNPEIEYYGFEPNPSCIYYVKELIRINQLKDVTLFPVGISEKTSIYELAFFADDEADSSASMIREFRPTQRVCRTEYITCFNISDVASRYDMRSIGILKIDVEGAEKEVIEGFKEKIVIDQPLIQIEILPVYDEKNFERLSRQKTLENLFKEIGYTILRIHTDKSKKLTHLEEIHEIGIHSNPNWCEYLIVPRNIKDAIIKRL